MAMFKCFLDHCLAGSQFCETKSERCRDCSDYKEECLIDNRHISSCSSYCLDLMMNNKSLSMTGNTTIPDETYLAENYHIVIGILSVLLMASFLMCLQQRYQLFSKIVKIFKSLCHTKADLPNIQNDLHTTQRLMGEDGHIFNETEKKTNGMMNENRDGVCMSNCGFNQHNQTPNATTDTPKLCTSGCIIDMPDA